MKRNGEAWIFWPRDLVRFLESPFACWHDLAVAETPEAFTPDPRSDADQLIFERAMRHERDVLARFREQGRDVVEIAGGSGRFDATRRAMEQGREVLYQGALSGGSFRGNADFLLRVDGPSALGDHHYEPLDAKLRRTVGAGALVQLACYADLLESIQGHCPDRLHVALGSGETSTVRTVDALFFYRVLRRAFLEFVERFDPRQPPAPRPDDEHREWSGRAEAWMAEVDHPARVANITAGQVRRLARAGVTTLRQLAELCDGEGVRRVEGLRPAIVERLSRQARLQILSADAPSPAFEVLRPRGATPLGLAALPPASPGDLYFDLESYPLAKEPLEYLFGVWTGDTLGRFDDWWAHDSGEERVAFESFVAWVERRRVTHPGLHVYHYGHYERAALERLMGRHGRCEQVLDRWFRSGVLVDLHRIVRHGLLVGEPRYSLKNLEHLYRERREGDVGTAVDSIVYYQRWLDSDEPRDWRRSHKLEKVRDYNRDDCRSTAGLAHWLRERQAEHGIAPAAPPGSREPADGGEEARDGERLAEELRRAAEVEAPGRGELLGQLVEFHRREDRPMWWAMFERHGMTGAELAEDVASLGELRLIGPTPSDDPRLRVFAYRMEREQETKLRPGRDCYFAHDLSIRAELVALHGDEVHVGLRPTMLARSGGAPPATLALIPDEYVSARPISASIRRLARDWLAGHPLPPALTAFLEREAPRIEGHDGGPLRRPGETAVEAARRVIPAMRQTTLSIQGPPGSGKTTTTAQVIVDLLRSGRRMAVSSNGHRAMLNLLAKCADLDDGEEPLPMLKVGGPGDDPLFRSHRGARHVRGSGDARPLLEAYPLVAGTAWLFSRPEMRDRFDYLVIDEAGQVSMANLCAMAPTARNLVLVGDQMQLPQPIQGSHPGESGRSTLDYLLGDLRTVPPEMGLFLDTSYRLHPDLCAWISSAFYEERLRAAPGRERRVLDPRPHRDSVESGGTIGDALDQATAGLLFLPVEHEGNTQGSNEEVEVVATAIERLVGRRRRPLEGPAVALTESDILVVAPYNLQVEKLKVRLPAAVRVGTVDKFQGQEAPVVIVSMCASDGQAGRGIDFLLDPNRLNVALSRAETLAVVVGHPGLARTRTRTLESFRRVNLYCRLLEEGVPRAI